MLSRARKWALGIVIAAIAAALGTYVTRAVTSGVEVVRDSVIGAPSPIAVTVTGRVHAKRRANFGSVHWIFAKPINSLTYPTTGDLSTADAWDAWAKENGGVEADQTGVEIVIEGTTQYPVIITGLSIEVTSRKPPPRGVHVVPFGGGAIGKRFFSVDLDRKPPVVESIPAEFEETPAVDFPYRVSQTEPEVFLIVAHTRECDCSWRAELNWVYNGEPGTTTIDDDGQPFRTASSERSTIYYATNGRFERG